MNCKKFEKARLKGNVKNKNQYSAFVDKLINNSKYDVRGIDNEMHRLNNSSRMKWNVGSWNFNVGWIFLLSLSLPFYIFMYKNNKIRRRNDIAYYDYNVQIFPFPLLFIIMSVFFLLDANIFNGRNILYDHILLHET